MIYSIFLETLTKSNFSHSYHVLYTQIKQNYGKLEHDIDIAIEEANEAAIGLQNFKHRFDSISEMLGRYEKVVEDLPNFGLVDKITLN